MRKNHWRFASILVFCAIVAGSAATPDRGASAADECLAAPKDSTPQGKHWYYRIERSSKRQCWYLGDEGRKTTQVSASAAPPESSPPEKTAPQQNREPMRPSVANARAELTKDIAVPFTPMPPLGQQNSAPVPRENPATQRTEHAPPPESWRLAERWLDAQTSNRVAQADSATPPVPVTTPAPLQRVPVRQTTVQQAVAPVSLSAPASDDTPDMLHMVLGIVTAAIAVAAIIGRLIASHMRPRSRPAQRRAIWQTVDEADVQPVYARARVHDPALRARAEQDVEELLRALRYPEQQPSTSPVVPASRGQRPRDPSGARA